MTMIGEDIGGVVLIAGASGIMPAKTTINFVINMLDNIAPTLFNVPVFGIPG
jgi:hypothetical protein